MFKKVLLTFLSLNILFLSIFTPLARAQDFQEGTWYFPNFDEWVGRVHDSNNPDEIFGERYTQAQVVWVIYSLMVFLMSALADQNIVMCFLANADDPAQLVAQCRQRLEDLIPQAAANNPQGGNFLSIFTQRQI